MGPHDPTSIKCEAEPDSVVSVSLRFGDVLVAEPVAVCVARSAASPRSRRNRLCFGNGLNAAAPGPGPRAGQEKEHKGQSSSDKHVANRFASMGAARKFQCVSVTAGTTGACDLAAKVGRAPVSRILSGIAISLEPQLPAASLLPTHGLGRTGLRRPLTRDCTEEGLPCRFRCRKRGGLLPHHFTLTTTASRGGGIFSVALSVGATLRPHRPGVTRSSVLRCPDFPHSPQTTGSRGDPVHAPSQKRCGGGCRQSRNPGRGPLDAFAGRPAHTAQF